jgi:hypothetical protein
MNEVTKGKKLKKEWSYIRGSIRDVQNGVIKSPFIWRSLICYIAKNRERIGRYVKPGSGPSLVRQMMEAVTNGFEEISLAFGNEYFTMVHSGLFPAINGDVRIVHEGAAYLELQKIADQRMRGIPPKPKETKPRGRPPRPIEPSPQLSFSF